MVIRNCAGGIVFHDNLVLMLCNDKCEWAFPKGVVRQGQRDKDVAKSRIKAEAGVDAEILAPCGKTYYEFYSISRQKPVHNNISWYVMNAESTEVTLDKDGTFTDGKFFPIEEALRQITYSQDKSLLMMAYQRYKELI